MNQIVSDILALIYTGFLLFGGGYTLKEVHGFVKYQTLKKVSEGLSSTEALSNALTGEQTGFLKKRANCYR